MPYSKKRADEVISFIEFLNLVGDFYGEPFKLQTWQKEVIRKVYGTVNSRGYRQFTTAYLEMPKKNGKTTLIAGLANYHCAMDPPSGEIYICAADKDQASICYDTAKSMIEQNEDLKAIFRVVDSKKEIHNSITGTFIKVMSAEAYSKHGLNPSVVIFDELHAQPNRDLWDVMTSNTGATRKEPLLWVITTAGNDPDRKSLGWEEHEYARKVIDGSIKDPFFYGKIYGAPQKIARDQIYDEKVWKQCNPSIGHSIDINNVRRDAVKAKNNPREEKNFMWLRLNIWIKNKKNGWLPLTAWDATTGNWTRKDLIGCYCYAGLDLATTWDMNGFALIFPPQKNFKDIRVIYDAWIPEENMKERVRRDGVLYQEWIDNGFMQSTAGNVTDYSAIRERILKYRNKYKIKELGYDKYNATETALMLAAAGIKMIPVDQTILGMSPSMKELEVLFKRSEGLVKEGKAPLITHEANPAARWCFGNVNTSIDGKGNYMPIKTSKTDRIDIFVAMIDAMARYMPHLAKKHSVYSKRGVIVV